jgi:hypothetical protein
LLLGLYRFQNLAFSRFFFKAKLIDFLLFSTWCIEFVLRGTEIGNRDGAHFKGQEGTATSPIAWDRIDEIDLINSILRFFY